MTTLFVVGAGASTEVGLPIGRDLTARIADLLQINFQRGEQVTGHPLIVEALRHHARSSSPSTNDINPYVHAARRISEGMPLSASIDGFIDNHRGDKQIELCGKLAIVCAILQAERGSKLYTERPHIQPNMREVRETWYNGFWRLFTEGCAREELPQRCTSCAFVVFNYDRCIQHFLYHASQFHYGLSDSDARQLVSNILFYHPYGSVGALPWKRSTSEIAFGGDVSQFELLKLAGQIKTFTEGTDPSSSAISEIRDVAQRADRVVFLGFAYHRQNLDLLWPNKGGPRLGSRAAYGTAYNISDPDVAAITHDISQRLDSDPKLVHVNNTLKCAQLFHHYSRGLSLA